MGKFKDLLKKFLPVSYSTFYKCFFITKAEQKRGNDILQRDIKTNANAILSSIEAIRQELLHEQSNSNQLIMEQIKQFQSSMFSEYSTILEEIKTNAIKLQKQLEYALVPIQTHLLSNNDMLNGVAKQLQLNDKYISLCFSSINEKLESNNFTACNNFNKMTERLDQWDNNITSNYAYINEKLESNSITSSDALCHITDELYNNQKNNALSFANISEMMQNSITYAQNEFSHISGQIQEAEMKNTLGCEDITSAIQSSNSIVMDSYDKLSNKICENDTNISHINEQLIQNDKNNMLVIDKANQILQEYFDTYTRDFRSFTEKLLEVNKNIDVGIKQIDTKIVQLDENRIDDFKTICSDLSKLEEDNQLQKNDKKIMYNKILSEFSACKSRVPGRQIYLNLTERAALSESFAKIMNDESLFEQKYNALVYGLDKQSYNQVMRILIRMQKAIEKGKSAIDIFSEEEQIEFYNLRDDFQTQILKISDSLYKYKNYLLPVNQFDSSVFYSEYGISLLENTKKFAEADIIDVGGYVGDTALLFSPYTKKNIYVFEASPSNCEIIEKTILLNNLKNVILENQALGAENGIAQFSLGERNSCNSLVERPGYVYPEHIDVNVITLDEYVQEHNIEVGLIKVDIEGGEKLFLKGAIETIKRFTPTLLLSIYHSADDFFDIKPMIENLNLGYSFKIYKPINNAIAIETVLIAEVI